MNYFMKKILFTYLCGSVMILISPNKNLYFNLFYLKQYYNVLYVDLNLRSFKDNEKEHWTVCYKIINHIYVS